MAYTPPFIRSAYNYDMDAESEKSGLKCKDKSLTQQEFAEESDINFIAERYGLTGELPQVLNLPSYGDFTGVFDFQTAQNAVRAAVEQFMTLPAKLRARFDNNPQNLLQFLDNPENADEARFLGLLKENTDETGTGKTAPSATQEQAPAPRTPSDTPATAQPEKP